MENNKIKILMIGIDQSGKTTLLYRWKLDKLIKSIPTIGFNVENIEYDDYEFNFWDVGGQDKIRMLWRHYILNTNVLLYVVDSSDESRFIESSESLKSFLTENSLENLPILVLANKSDLDTSQSKVTIENHFQLASFPNKVKIISVNFDGAGKEECFREIIDMYKSTTY